MTRETNTLHSSAHQVEAPQLVTGQWVTFFPWGDFEPGAGYVCYGPFDTLKEAKEHARTLSLDPDEGKVARLEKP